MTTAYTNEFAGRTPTIEELESADDQEMRRALVSCLWDDDRFAVFLEIEIVDRAYEVLREVVAWTQAQAAEHHRKSKEHVRLGAKVAQMHLRLGHLRNEIRRLNKEENETADAKLRRITRFAYELACALELRGAEATLNSLKIDEDCTARQFLDNYEAKLAKKVTA